jgi:3-hydroxyacyl-[acyl-carrier-protein] dehydratase
MDKDDRYTINGLENTMTLALEKEWSKLNHNQLASQGPLDLSVDVKEIMEWIPHRYPMLLVDRLEQIVLGQRAIGIKSVTINEWFFPGHFPDEPVMPGVLIIESMAQTAAVLVMKTLGKRSDQYVVYFMSITEARFRKPVYPGNTLALHVVKQQCRGNVWKFKGMAYVEDQLMAEAEYTAMIAKRP